MRYFYILILFIGLFSCNSTSQKSSIVFAQNPVIAHRGAWKGKGLPKNSIASLKEAIQLNCTGSEFDVRMTADEVLIVTHDANYNGLNIETSTYEELSKFKLSNGEKLPTLKEYLLAGMTNNTATSLVCEIKPSKFKDHNTLIAGKVVQLVKELKAEAYVSYYISFSYEIIKHIKIIEPKARVLYLDGSKKPKELKKDSITGFDYLIYKLKTHPNWITEAKNLNLVLNAWTANKTDDIDWLLANDFDYITTDEPELVLEKFKNFPVAKDYELVWSDEFNYTGKPDTLKWNHEVGFKRNQEKQYYTDSLKNSRVEKGVLILESHKEKVANTNFKSTTDPDWRSNQKYGSYTSTSLHTNGLAQWRYGRIDIRAKLPKGVGLWPAFWMLGENQPEVGWPECGEIDIMEHVGFNADSIFGTIHTKAYNHMIGTQRGKTIKIEKPYETFHIYSIIWTPESIDFLLDDEVYNHIENDHKTTAEWPFDQNFYIKINTAIGGMLGGRKGIDDTIFPQQLLIDYVRVYQKKKEL